MDKAFAPTARNIITCTIDENGDVLYLATDANDAFLNDGTEVTRRASHVEPNTFWARQAFYVLRWFGDKGRIAEWTRNWSVQWRVNTKPVGGPILTWGDVHPHAGSGYFHINRNQTATWGSRTFGIRQDAIDAEIKFLNDFFLERGIQ